MVGGGGGGNGRSVLEKMGEILGLFPLLDFFSLHSNQSLAITLSLHIYTELY